MVDANQKSFKQVSFAGAAFAGQKYHLAGTGPGLLIRIDKLGHECFFFGRQKKAVATGLELAEVVQVQGIRRQIHAVDSDFGQETKTLFKDGLNVSRRLFSVLKGITE